MSRLWVLLAAAALDWLLGDPAWMPHPIRLMGWTISRLETGLRRLFPRTPGGELLAGGVLVLTMVLLFGGGEPAAPGRSICPLSGGGDCGGGLAQLSAAGRPVPPG